MPNPESIGPASIALGTATSSFMGFLPKFSDIRRADPNDEGMKKDVMLGQIAAISVAIGTGIIISSLSGSFVPTVVAMLISVVLVWCYQMAMRS